MNLKHKVGFIALITIIDVMVIVFVIMNNDKTSINNNVSAKSSANIIAATVNQEKLPEHVEEPVIVEVQTEELTEELTEEETEEIIIERDYVSYDDLSVEEREVALQNGTLALEYSGLYTNSSDRLTKSRGALYYNGHKETYYSEKVLPGSGLKIPGRHVADDGTIRDEDGYICVAADWSYMPKGSILVTSLGPAKVYDTGCSYGTIDIYVSW